jgi:hypothetical protein
MLKLGRWTGLRGGEAALTPDAGLVAECLSHDVFVQADDWDGLRAQVLDAVAGCFFDADKPGSVKLHFVRDELLAVA